VSFALLILKNLLRQRARTVLAVLGISLGITTVVALGVITNGLRSTAGEVIRAAGADFMIGQKGAADLTFSTIHEDDVKQLAARQDVDRAVGVLIVIKRVGANPFFSLVGIDPAQLEQVELDVREGRRFSPDTRDEIMLGDAAANDLDAKLGERVTLDGQTFRVVGTYHTGNLWQDKGAYVPLRTLQEQSGRTGVVTVVYVWTKAGQDRNQVAAAIGSDHPGLAPILSESDYGEIDQGMDMINAANFAISLLAVGIGAIGVMNTMVMAVVERTREIGVLRAVGWRGSRIIIMVLAESMLLCAAAVLIGIGLGILASQGALTLSAVGGLIEPNYDPAVFLQAVIVAVSVALVGAAYPSFRAVRLTPMEALRHE
jgi:putative ABC transport system permease protein